MLGKEPFEIIIASGVARFDSVGNLFVNLPHGEDDPMPVVIGDTTRSAPEKRARVHGPASDNGSAKGAFNASPKLPRGLTVELKGYSTASLADGRLTVAMPAGSTLPDWFESGATHVFERPGDSLKLWVKSSLPEGVTLADADAVDTGPPTQPKPVARAQFQPDSSAFEPPPAAAYASSGAADSPTRGPYRPGRLPAGHMAADRDQRKTGLGCSTLVLVVALAALSLVALI